MKSGPDVEQAGFLKLSFREGEIDFVVSGSLTQSPFVTETLLGRDVRIETSTEIIAKKVWHRGAEFTARDLFDLTDAHSMSVLNEQKKRWLIRNALFRSRRHRLRARTRRSRF